MHTCIDHSAADAPQPALTQESEGAESRSHLSDQPGDRETETDRKKE